MISELLDLLAAMKHHAERERQAMRQLDGRGLFELAGEGEKMARRLAYLLTQATPELIASQSWQVVCARASEVRVIARTNAELMRRSLDVIRATRRRLPVDDDAPAFVSRVA